MPHLTREPIDPARLLASVAGPDRGGCALFVGTVRDHHAGQAVTALEYTAYEPMAEAESAAIVA
jgi:molybdopterin synthase catalytic subunit